MITASAYLGFNGEAASALEFYQTVLGGNLQITRHGDLNFSEHADWVMHGQLDTDMGWTLMAADHPNGESPTVDGRVTICIWGDDEERMTAIFHGLAEGGTVQMPLDKQVWGDHYGDLHDKFGVYWAVNIGAR